MGNSVPKNKIPFTICNNQYGPPVSEVRIRIIHYKFRISNLSEIYFHSFIEIKYPGLEQILILSLHEIRLRPCIIVL